MKTPPKLSNGSHRSFNSTVRIAIFVVAIAVIGIPLFSSSSASFLGRVSRSSGRVATPATSSRVDLGSTAQPALGTNIGGITNFPLIMPQAAPTPAIATYDPTCVTPDSEFNLGQGVCATATTTGGSAARRRITWSDPDGFVRQSTPVTSDPASDQFTIPSTPTSTLSNGQVVNNVGKWRVNLVGRTLVTFATFVVKDPANATADLSVTKNAPSGSQSVAAGSNGSFDIFVLNSGPDAAATVSVVDHVPANTTFVSMTQTSGPSNPSFTCTTVPDGVGNVTCSIDSLAAGASATFNFVYTVNAGTPSGTSIDNTVSISSATTNERNTADNSAAASAAVAGGGGAGSCSLTCPASITTAADTTDGSGAPGAIVHFDEPSASGSSCGTVSIDHCNDCFFPVGTTTVSASENGTTGDSCSFTVTVTEGAPPTITCPTDKTATANSTCEATVDAGTPTTTGDGVTVTSSRSDGLPLSDPYPAGTTTITWTATNNSGTASCSQAITVNDTTLPTITCPANVVASNDAGQCSAVINPGTATATDNCGTPTVTGERSDSQPLDAAYPKGTTTITWTATDDAGNTASCTQTVTVNDTESPTVTCPANISTNTDPGACSAAVNPVATASDNCPGATVSGSRSDGQALSAPYPKGTTTITWRATDASGNTSSECTSTVTVADHENPTITCPANISVNEEPGTCAAHVNPGTPTASDNCGSPTVSGSRSDGKPLSDPYPLGTTTITWTATDSSGNQSSCTQTITVIDNVPPTITFDSLTIFLNNLTVVFTTNSVTINGTTYPFNGTSCTHNGYTFSFNGSTLTITYNNHSSSYTFSGKTLVLWTPTHQYQTVKVADLIASASDDCDPGVDRSDVRITQVTSDEPDDIAGGGDGNTVNDMVIAPGCTSVQLRAERNGNGNGRVYTITFKVRDASGNTTTATSKLKIFASSLNVVDDGPQNTVNGTCPLP